MRRLLVLTLLLACDPRKLDTAVLDTGGDADGDGFGPPSDCDDARADLNPLAVERCDGLDNDCDGATDEDDAVDALPFYPDADADGYGALAYGRLFCEAPEGWVEDHTDCDDEDALAWPGAEERCDGVDNDCDGTADEPGATGSATWYIDEDGDGWGNAARVELACEAPADGVAIAGDCDDTDADISPDAVETCAEGDEDCDLLFDDEDTEISDAPLWYEDADGDGWGDRWVDVEACAAPEGYVSDPGDCETEDPQSHPGAAERCGDGVDNDCDGLADDAADPSAVPLDWYADADGDGYGDAEAPMGESCEALSGAAADASDCDDADAAVSPGAAEIWYDGVDQDCDGADADADGDGADAEAMGGADCDDADAEHGPDAPEVCGDGDDDDCDGLADPCAVSATWTGTSGGDRAGAAVAPAGDQDGDGVSDGLVGAPWRDRGGANAGVVYVVPGDAEGGLTDADGFVEGAAADDEAGAALVGGQDADGDGTADAWIGAPGDDTEGAGSGATYLLYGPVGGSVSVSTADATRRGEEAGDGAGATLADAGDVDGDGGADLWIGAPAAGGGAGGAWLLLGPVEDDHGLTWSEASWAGTAAGDGAATGLAGGADVDGDGLDDALVGAPGLDAGAGATGGAWLLLGTSSGALSLADADATLLGEAAGDRAGASVALGDLDGDGRADLWIGGPEADGLGAAWLVLGATGDLALADADAVVVGEATGDGLGAAVALLEDGDGGQLLAVGAPGVDHDQTDQGAVWVLPAGLAGRGAAVAHGGAAQRGDSGGDALGQALAGGELLWIGAPQADGTGLALALGWAPD